ncbi:NUDIX hydrolase [Thermomonospora amylolytica]|uniref:NUDIX hydrolase n=1 Tax=Thermomonospora amylolytica TaxID=1411117 RepID=UPI000E6B72CE|nr:NUDIX domain-containing protein [Thermomonospora amylolytica]
MSTVRCVGAIVLDEAGRLLVIRRGRPPGEGLWSIPGGRVEPGESDAEAVAREVREETGLVVRVGGYAGTIHRPGLHGTTYEVHDYLATVVGGTLRPGDDAAEARWASVAELRAMPTTEALVETLTGWGALPAE